MNLFYVRSVADWLDYATTILEMAARYCKELLSAYDVPQAVKRWDTLNIHTT